MYLSHTVVFIPLSQHLSVFLFVSPLAT